MNKAPLSTIADVIRGVSFSKDEGYTLPSEGRLPVIRAGSIQESLLLDVGQIWVPETKVKESQKIRRDDIVMCTSSGSSSLVGKCAKAEVDFDGSFGAFCAGIRPNKDKVSASYLYHFLSSPAFRNWTSSSSGANIKNIRISELAEFEIPLPPLEEQKRIATILDKADAIRRKRQQAIQLADEFLRSVFLDMFGDPETNLKGWNVTTLTSCGSFKNGLNFRKGEVGHSLRYLGVGGFKSLKTIGDMGLLGDVELNTVPAKDYLLENGDLVFVRSNGNKDLVGRCVTVYPDGEPLTFSGFCIRYRVESESVDSEYLNYLFGTSSMKKAMLKGGQGANIQNINQKILSGLKIPLPPIELQNKFSRIVKEYRRSMLRFDCAIGEADGLFGAIRQISFQGNLGVGG